MNDLYTVASTLAKTDDLIGALALLNANGLSLHDTFTVHSIVLANRILRSSFPPGIVPAVAYADLIRPETKES